MYRLHNQFICGKHISEAENCVDIMGVLQEMHSTQTMNID
jgi:hypothetical protein